MSTVESSIELALVVAAAVMFVWAGVNWWLNWRLSRRQQPGSSPATLSDAHNDGRS